MTTEPFDYKCTGPYRLNIGKERTPDMYIWDCEGNVGVSSSKDKRQPILLPVQNGSYIAINDVGTWCIGRIARDFFQQQGITMPPLEDLVAANKKVFEKVSDSLRK